jgi:hypothetical protein
VVVTIMFCLRDFVTEATTGSLIPLSENALLNAFLSASGEKSVLVPVGDLTRMRRFEGSRGLADFAFGFGLLPTRVHSWGLIVVVFAPFAAAAAYELDGLGWADWLGWLGWLGCLSRASALDLVSICRVAVSRLATCEAIICLFVCLFIPFNVLCKSTTIVGRLVFRPTSLDVCILCSKNPKCSANLF